MLVLVAVSLLAQANPYLGRVLVVINDASPTSLALGADYLKERGMKDRLIVHCQDSSQSATLETIDYASFHDSIEIPLRTYLAKHPNIDFIVLTKGIPIRIPDAPGIGLGNNRPSVDSYIAALDYDKVPGAFKIQINDSGFKGTCWANRFWNSNERFSHAKFGGYLVTRLDGYTMDDARLLVRYAIQSEKQPPSGTILIDAKASYPSEQLAKQPVPVFAKPPEAADPSKAALADVGYNDYDMDLNEA